MFYVISLCHPNSTSSYAAKFQLEYVKTVLTRTHVIEATETKSPNRLLSLQSMDDSVVERFDIQWSKD